jgi:hypothetical protein
MANLKDSPTFAKHDDYYTPESAWQQVAHLIPRNSKVWEACMLGATKSKSPEYLSRLDNVREVVADTNLDMLVDAPPKKHPINAPDGVDLIVTNIPFSTSIKKKVLTRLVELDIPFMIIMNSMNLYSNYMRDIFGDEISQLQVVVPRGKIHFDKLDYDTGELRETKNCSFYCVYVCYKMNIPSYWLFLK